MTSSEPFQLLAVAAVVMCLSHTLAKERIGAPLRDWVDRKSGWAGYLVSCPYCLSHWLAFILVPLTCAYYVHVAVRWGVLSRGLEWFFSSILVTAVAAFLRVAFYFINEEQGILRRRGRLLDEREGAAEGDPAAPGHEPSPDAPRAPSVH